MAWFYFALGTAIAWGIGYSLTEKVLHSGVSSSFFLLSLCCVSVPVYIFLSLYGGTARESIQALNSGNSLLLLAFVGAIIAYIFGNIFIMHAINLKNATYANLIEISYPVFTILFTYLFFKNFHLNWTTLAGGVLIFCGALLIVYKGE